MTVEIIRLADGWGVAVTQCVTPHYYKTRIHKVKSREDAGRTARYFRERLGWAGCLSDTLDKEAGHD